MFFWCKVSVGGVVWQLWWAGEEIGAALGGLLVGCHFQGVCPDCFDLWMSLLQVGLAGELNVDCDAFCLL